jgi:hypothetical protein
MSIGEIIDEKMKPLIWWRHEQSGSWWGAQAESSNYAHTWNLYEIRPAGHSKEIFSAYFAQHNYEGILYNNTLESCKTACQQHLKIYLKSFLEVNQ